MDKGYTLAIHRSMYLKLERWNASLEITTTKKRALAKAELVYRGHGN